MARTAVQWPGSGALIRRVEQLRTAADQGSRAAAWCRNDLRIIIERDNEDKFMRGVDRYGRPFQVLAKRTSERRKPGQNLLPLIPHGFASRVIQNFEVVLQEGLIVARWIDIPWIVYHITGGKWLPRRDPSGITPKGWYQVRQRFQEYVRDVANGKG